MKYNTAIIGGGPAGMMAGIAASKNKEKVILIEKNKELGCKLLITGKGRCNITHNSEDIKSFIEAFGKQGKFLYSALNAFSIKDTIKFFNDSGLKTKVERGERVFPVSNKACDVRDVLLRYLKKQEVKILYNSEVKSIVKKEGIIKEVHLKNGTSIIAENFIIATGGLSYPKTGSTGDGFRWARVLGHTVMPLKPALTPIILEETWIRELQGLSLKNVLISVYKGLTKKDEKFGEALFTDNGMSGPIILDLSKNIGLLLPDVLLKLDFKPALSPDQLDRRIQRDFKEYSNKVFKNSLDKLLPKKLIPVIIKLSGISEFKKVHSITKQERGSFVKLLKEFEVNVKSLEGFKRSVVTSGGIALKEVDPRTMKSKIVDNLYFAGEALDLDGPTGGYNLQVCFSTGFVAGNSL